MIQPPPKTLTPIETHKLQQKNDIPQASSSSSQSAQQTPSQAYSLQMEQPQQMQQTAGQIPPAPPSQQTKRQSQQQLQGNQHQWYQQSPPPQTPSYSLTPSPPDQHNQNGNDIWYAFPMNSYGYEDNKILIADKTKIFILHLPFFSLNNQDTNHQFGHLGPHQDQIFTFNSNPHLHQDYLLLSHHLNPTTNLGHRDQTMLLRVFQHQNFLHLLIHLRNT